MGRNLPPYRIRVTPADSEWPPDVLISLEAPSNDGVAESFSVEIRGFVTSRADSGVGPPRRLCFLVGGTRLWEVLINLPRPDLLQAPNALPFVDPDNIHCGFDAILPSFLSIRDEPIELQVVHKMDEHGRQSRYTLCYITFESTDEQSDLNDDIGVICINSLGRSGSSVLCRLLDMHPSCLVPRLEGQYGETTLFGHYLRAISVVSSEGALSYLNALDAGADFLSFPLGYLKCDFGESPHYSEFYRRASSSSRELMIELFHRVTRDLSEFAQKQKPGCTYWVEKTWNATSANIGRLLLKRWKELILVREFRSFWRSQLAFQRKIGASPEVIREHAIATVDKYINLASKYEDRRDQCLLISYEHLMQSPEACFDEIFSFLELSYDAALVAKIVDDLHSQSEHRRLVSGTDVEQDATSNLDEYLSALAPNKLGELRDSLVLLGYEPRVH